MINTKYKKIILYLIDCFRMYLDPELTIEDRWKVTQMMFGAQSDVHDYHKVNFLTDYIFLNF